MTVYSSAYRVNSDTRVLPPAWAFWERHLLEEMSRAALEFVDRYTRPDGTLVWRESWPGMDGSDDGYESFVNFPLLTALGGDLGVDALARREWEAVTRQFTAYGQVYREFDAYYDWMHHGESSLLFYDFGLTQPDDNRMRARAERFARMYMGLDPEAPNYDPQRHLIRSPINGSRGPRFENSAEDWVTHRPVLANYPPPFEDIPGLNGPTADWNDDETFHRILRLLNHRMMSGDVPLNLAATSLIATAFCYTGNPHYREWTETYAGAWMERARENGGLLPDNVGLSGRVGECMDGKWWGGYYGWRWPHGWMNLADSATIASANALLLTGRREWLSLLRSQLDGMLDLAKKSSGSLQIPHRHGDHGWYDFRVPDPTHAIQLWYLSMDESDRERVEKLRHGSDWRTIRPGRGKGDNIHTAPWWEYLQGRLQTYPEAILQAGYTESCRRLEAIRNDTTDPESWDVHHWQDLNPVVCEGLLQLTLGGPARVYHGGLLHTRLRYFDPDERRAGLPPATAALVSRVDAEGVTLELVNLDPLRSRRVLAQAGSYGEHRFLGHRTGNQTVEFDEPQRTVEFTLGPACGMRIDLRMGLFAGSPRYSLL